MQSQQLPTLETPEFQHLTSQNTRKTALTPPVKPNPLLHSIYNNAATRIDLHRCPISYTTLTQNTNQWGASQNIYSQLHNSIRPAPNDLWWSTFTQFTRWPNPKYDWAIIYVCKICQFLMHGIRLRARPYVNRFWLAHTHTVFDMRGKQSLRTQ